MGEVHLNKGRIASVDAFRAITMFMMLFVNFFAGMSGIPHWMHHAATHEDMLGLSDTVFPAFLFAVGLSIPLAIGRRRERGDTLPFILAHIFIRTLALLVMGVFMVNLEFYSAEGALLPYDWYMLLMATGIVLVWNDYPKSRLAFVLRLLGLALLLFLYFVYKGKEPFAFHWWGILGLIGWAYLFCSLLYLLTGGKTVSVAGAWLLVVAACVLNWIIPGGLLRVVPLFGWTGNALCFSGLLLSVVMRRFAEPKKLLLFCLAAGVLLLCGFFICHKFWIISKNLATPTWFFLCTALYFPVFALLYQICDGWGHTAWYRPIKPAGTATLSCYLIPYFMLPVMSLAGLYVPALNHGVPGLLNALALSVFVVVSAGLLSKIGIKLKI